MKIIVCMKQVIDPEAPVSTFAIDEEARKAIPPKGTPPVLNPYDENALEAALQIKDGQEAEITVLSMGPQIARPVVKKALAVGADAVILIEDPACDGLDSHAAAAVLTAAIKKLDEYDLIICGRQASDTDAGQVGSGIAEMLGLPCVTAVQKVSAADGGLKLERVAADGYDVVSCPLPAVITASNEIGDLRMATVKQLMAANKMQPAVQSLADLGVDPAALKKTVTRKLYQPVVEVNTEIIAGETPEEAGANLAAKLKEDQVL